MFCNNIMNSNSLYIPNKSNVFLDKISFASTRKHQVINGMAVNCNYTNMFRTDINWDKLVDYLSEKYKNVPKVNIYCYACSDGSEPYSLAIKLIDKLGMEKAQKFFPIIARDINKDIMQTAKDGIIYFHDGDFKAINENLKRYNFNDFFCKNERLKPDIQRNIQFVAYNISPKIKNCVEFSAGDITKDIDDLDLTNSVLIFRNAWTYLPLKTQRKLSEKISCKMNNSSAVLIGNSDLLKSNASEYLRHNLNAINNGVYVGGETNYPSITIGLPKHKNPISNDALFEKE